MDKFIKRAKEEWEMAKRDYKQMTREEKKEVLKGMAIYGAAGVIVIGGIYAMLLMVFQRSGFKGSFRDLYDSLMNVILTQKLTPGPELTDQLRPKLCYGLAIAIGTGLYTILSLTGRNPFA